MNERDKRTVVGIVEQIVLQVAETEFYRLTEGLSSNQRLDWVSDARRSLEGLRFLRSPDYADPLVALFYAVQYQLAHINIAFSIVEHIRSTREANRIF